ncbi:hypothetical protein PSZ90_24305, partial [Shigella sonnei]|nr:hypothetical protein [Shigella sonnei]
AKVFAVAVGTQIKTMLVVIKAVFVITTSIVFICVPTATAKTMLVVIKAVFVITTSIVFAVAVGTQIKTLAYTVPVCVM